MQTEGRHVIADLWCPVPGNDALLDLIETAITHSRMTVVDHVSHAFTPQGLTAIWLLAESHVSVHTYPEKGYIALDIYTCGNEGNPEQVLAVIAEHLGLAAESNVLVLARGTAPGREQGTFGAQSAAGNTYPGL